MRAFDVLIEAKNKKGLNRLFNWVDEQPAPQTPKRVTNADFLETSCPGDKIIICHTPGMISNTIDIHFINSDRREERRISLQNKIESWKYLKQIDDMGGREVRYQIGANDDFKFKGSDAYKCRFK